MVKGAIRLLGGTLLFGQPRSIIAFVYICCNQVGFI